MTLLFDGQGFLASLSTKKGGLNLSKTGSLTNWSSWISRHPNEFLQTTGALLTGLATLVLAVITIVMYQGNSRLIALNTKQFNRRFLSQIYEDLLLLMTDTLDTIRGWISDLENSTNGFIAGNTVSKEEVERQRGVAIKVGIKMDLYPNEKINPLSNDWMGLLGEEMTEFASLYREEYRDKYGRYAIPDADRLEAIKRLKAIADDLDSRREAIAKAMSVELRL